MFQDLHTKAQWKPFGWVVSHHMPTPSLRYDHQRSPRLVNALIPTPSPLLISPFSFSLFTSKNISCSYIHQCTNGAHVFNTATIIQPLLYCLILLHIIAGLALKRFTIPQNHVHCHYTWHCATIYCGNEYKGKHMGLETKNLLPRLE